MNGWCKSSLKAIFLIVLAKLELYLLKYRH